MAVVSGSHQVLGNIKTLVIGVPAKLRKNCLVGRGVFDKIVCGHAVYLVHATLGNWIGDCFKEIHSKHSGEGQTNYLS